ncbi:MAG: peptidoglycan DD-metalloendopeptidase family protein [Chitinophagaceae bacterium]|nr:peptidoglycan DD-metalloendopeptidase family protein [Chitinophagaceae bacterium]
MLPQILAKHSNLFVNVVPFDATTNKLLLMDFTSNNKTLTNKILADTSLFSQYVNEQLQQANAVYGIGGYNEHRTIYARSEVFDGTKEPRRIHLGIDVWGKAGTPVFAPIGGMIHSFAFNNQFGDYGATIILQHQLEGVQFHTLYGHLSLASIEHLQEGKYVSQGELLAHFGEPHENGNWPPHLHFQIIEDMDLKEGDYPGVCALSEREKYVKNCPDANLILQMMQYV